MSPRDWRECEVVRSQVLDLISRDAEFLPGFRPAILELKLEAPDGSPLEYAGVKVRGKVDRIDMDDQGNALIIDYKLSGLASGYGLVPGQEFPDRIQTDIYATLVQRHFALRGEVVNVVGSVYRSYAKNNLRGIYRQGIQWGPVEDVKPKKDSLPNAEDSRRYAEYLEALEEEMRRRLAWLDQGKITPEPRCDDACSYCLAASFCPKAR